MWIAWNIKDTDISWPPRTIEEKVEIFYQRALGWQLHVADLLANGGQPLGKSCSVKRLEHSGFAVLQICLSYFETVGHYEQRNPAPTAKIPKGYFFKEGVRSVLPQLLARHGEAVFDELVGRLYGGARCGLYHNSMTVPGVGLGQPSGDAPIGYDSYAKRLAISPERLARALKVHLEQFRALLLDPKNVELRQNFERRFNKDNGISERES
jgi:hypothetical protein